MLLNGCFERIDPVLCGKQELQRSFGLHVFYTNRMNGLVLGYGPLDFTFYEGRPVGGA
jgi:hypothetical protein